MVSPLTGEIVELYASEVSMKLLNDLFSTDYGLMSIIGIGFMLCMAAFFVRMFLVKMNEPPTKDPVAAARASRGKNLPSSR